MNSMLTLALPVALSARLDGMLALADGVDQHTTRKELVAALIFSAPTNSVGIGNRVKSLRSAMLIEAKLPGLDLARLVESPRNRGPRSKSELLAQPHSERAPDARDLHAPLAKSKAYRVGIAVPGPIERHLDRLVEVASIAGCETNRRELVAALILAAPEDGRGISKIVRRYRAATPQDLDRTNAA